MSKILNFFVIIFFIHQLSFSFLLATEFSSVEKRESNFKSLISEIDNSKNDTNPFDEQSDYFDEAIPVEE